jgi:hypothetical protein
MSRRDLAEAGAVMFGAVVVAWAFLVAFVSFPVWGPILGLWLWWRGR